MDGSGSSQCQARAQLSCSRCRRRSSQKQSRKSTTLSNPAFTVRNLARRREPLRFSDALRRALILREPSVELLLVENSSADARLVIEALRESPTAASTHVNVARSGEEALAFLQRVGNHAAAPRPRLVILDLDLPGMPGQDVLAEIKADRTLRTIPVVVLTNAHRPEEVVQSYELHVNAYVTKPIHLEAFVSAVESIASFWLETATLPPLL